MGKSGYGLAAPQASSKALAAARVCPALGSLPSFEGSRVRALLGAGIDVSWSLCSRAVDILRTASATSHMRLLIARDDDARSGGHGTLGGGRWHSWAPQLESLGPSQAQSTQGRQRWPGVCYCALMGIQWSCNGREAKLVAPNSSPACVRSVGHSSTEQEDKFLPETCPLVAPWNTLLSLERLSGFGRRRKEFSLVLTGFNLCGTMMVP